MKQLMVVALGALLVMSWHLVARVIAFAVALVAIVAVLDYAVYLVLQNAR